MGVFFATFAGEEVVVGAVARLRGDFLGAVGGGGVGVVLLRE
jgi:hypothetical protein